MFREPTVIVLGAGASRPYRFPTGAGLIDEVIAAPDNRVLFEALRNGGMPRAEDSEIRDYLAGFIRELTDAHPPSIDTWLFHRRDFEASGKVIMAFHLMKFEDNNLMHRRGKDPEQIAERWYGDFLNTLGNDPEEIAANSKTLRIVTFNYDRSFEEFAYRKFKAHFRLGDADAAQLVQSLNIHHVYGQLGSLDWQTQHIPGFPSDHVRVYGRGDDLQNAHYAAKQVKLIHECNGDPEIEATAKAIADAEFVFLIGFGFHEENIDLLQLDKSHALIYATDRGLPEPKKHFAEDRLPNLYWAEGSAAQLVYSNVPFAEVVTGRMIGTAAERRANQGRIPNIVGGPAAQHDGAG